MNGLSIWLPPFASDYSGAASVLEGMKCFTVFLDAACCTKAYSEYDNPSWSGGIRTVLSAKFSSTEITLGLDEELISQITKSAKALDSNLIALIGTPVSSVCGMDEAGMAAQIEGVLGIPCIGINTKGFYTYESGAAAAMTAVLKKAAERYLKTPENNLITADGDSITDIIPDSVNLLGINPLDYGDAGSLDRIIRNIEHLGQKINCVFPGRSSFYELARIGSASENLVFSVSAVPAAEYLEKTHGTPWRFASLSADITLPRSRILILTGDQVITSSIRRLYREQGYTGHIICASFFNAYDSLFEPLDLCLKSEEDYAAMLKLYPDCAVLGDPLLKLVPETSSHEFLPFTHPAVSGRLGFENAAPLSLK